MREGWGLDSPPPFHKGNTPIMPQQNLTLHEKINLSPDIAGFVFEKQPGFTFEPGQFLQWTLPHQNPDNRGINRYFTISASPTESFLMLTTRFSQNGSTFKKALQSLEPGKMIAADNLEGNFTLPQDQNQPCVFLAGGIGITPFRSMIKYLIDRNEQRAITLLYSAKSAQDFVFKDLFDEAKEKINLKVVYLISENAPANWPGRTGFIDFKLIQEEVPQCLRNLFYISGPKSMVGSFTKTLKDNGVDASKIKHDFFPGYN